MDFRLCFQSCLDALWADPLACCWCRGAPASKQELKVVRGAGTSSTLPNLVAAARRQAVWRRRTGSATFISGPEIEVSCATFFPSLVKLMLFQTCCVQLPAWTGSDSPSGLMPKQFIPSEFLGRVVGGLQWHLVGVEPPRRVCHELDDVRVADLEHFTRLRHNSSFHPNLLHCREECAEMLVSAELHSSGVTFLSGPEYEISFVLVRRGFQSFVGFSPWSS